MKIFIRIIRVILGLALLAAFAFGLYTFAQAAPKSGDYLAQLEEQPAPVSPVKTLNPGVSSRSRDSIMAKFRIRISLSILPSEHHTAHVGPDGRAQGCGVKQIQKDPGCTAENQAGMSP